MAQRSCALPECGNPHYGKGYCRLHWRRFAAHGDPLQGRKLQSPTCKIDSCATPPLARDLCSKHYRALLAHGDPLADHRPQRQICEVDECGRFVHGHGWCFMHYQRWRAHGDPEWEAPKHTTCTIGGCDRPTRSLIGGLCEAHYCKRWRNGTLEVGQCETCQGPLPINSTIARRFCAPCALERRRNARRNEVHRRRALMTQAECEVISSREIFERDAWRCGICRRKVNAALTWPHPRSASLDHIQPLALGGLHVRSNVQLAHLTCNLSKQHRGGGEQFLLFG